MRRKTRTRTNIKRLVEYREKKSNEEMIQEDRERRQREAVMHDHVDVPPALR